MLDEDFTIETPETKTCLSLACKVIALLSCESIEHRQFADSNYHASLIKHDLIRMLMKIICGKSFILFGHLDRSHFHTQEVTSCLSTTRDSSLKYFDSEFAFC